MRPTRLWLPLAAAAAACAPDFLPRSFLADLRVIAIVADPPELAPVAGCTPGPADSCYGVVRLAAATLPPPGVDRSEVVETWSFCPFSAGSQAGYACAVPQCEVTCTPTSTGCAAAGGTATADPVLLAAQCLASLAQGGGLPPGLPAELPARVEVLFRHVARAAGQERESVLRLPVWRDGPPTFPDGAVQEVNRNPAFEGGLAVGGEVLAEGQAATAPLPRGGKVEVCATLRDGSAQDYLDASGTRVSETPVVSFFTTAGRFDFDRANGPRGCVQLEAKELPEGEVTAELWVVALDLRGGSALAGPFRVAIR